jgi:predicted ribosome quality control (RQC) complex YloA/Tae2 family protein
MNDFWRFIITIILIPLVGGIWNYFNGERKSMKAEIQEMKKELDGYKKREREMSVLIYEHLDMINQLQQEIRLLKDK